jgi:purine-binding chemotaxis protein CheW
MNVIAKTQATSSAVTNIRQALEGGQYLTFVLGGEVYALGILNIKEIIHFGDITNVPMMPLFVRGVINLRGSVVPVVDLLARFGRGSTQIAKRTGIVIVETSRVNHDHDEAIRQDIGIIVDAVNEVVEINATEIEPPPAFGARIRSDFISGMAKKDNRFVIVLNTNQVLSIDEMAALSKISIDEHQMD